MDTLSRLSHRPTHRAAQTRCSASGMALTRAIASAAGADAKC
jgi:hypothetical protein